MNQLRVICDLPNASNEISGVKFTPLEDGGVISELISREVADNFLSIPGYSPYEAAGEDEDDGAGNTPPPPPPPPAPTSRPPTKAQLAAAKKAEEVAKKAAVDLDKQTPAATVAPVAPIEPAAPETPVDPTTEGGTGKPEETELF